MKILKITFCFVLMACAMYFPLKDYTNVSEAERKENNIQVCLGRTHYLYKEPWDGKPLSIKEAEKKQIKCREMYKLGVRHAELADVVGFLDTPLMQRIRERNIKATEYCSKLHPKNIEQIESAFSADYDGGYDEIFPRFKCVAKFIPTVEAMFIEQNRKGKK